MWQNFTRFIHDNWVYWTKEDADDGDRYGVSDERRDEPYDEFEAMVKLDTIYLDGLRGL